MTARKVGRGGEARVPAIGFRQFVWLWNRCQALGTPPLHLEIADWLGRHWRDGDRRLVMLVFRNAGKSTLVGIFCAWLLANDPNLRILVLAAEHDLTMYDATYAAVAASRDATLTTLDAALLRAGPGRRPSELVAALEPRDW